MNNQNKIREDSQSVQSHLSILQNVIQRMASNSSSSKAWCITLVSAILIIVTDKGKPHYALIAIIPTFLFFVLDTYYLSLEKGFRGSYNHFINKLHNGEIETEDLFAIKPKGKLSKLFFESIVSFSVWPFYLTLLLMIYITKILVL
ncbi:MAG: hypothetical protein ISS28_06665 [Candidatus Cloacimonetes bacterium]|nr:hypothetical protein [Candidatus Cloacimonadota bacterium]